MKSLKSKIKFNEIRNKKEKLKAKLKTREKPKKDNVKTDKASVWYKILIVITGLGILMFGVIFLFAIYIVISAPSFNEDDLFNKDSTIIYKANGEVLTTLGMNAGDGNVERRTKLTYEELPDVLIDAVVATEDSRFFQHNGVDLARFIKASIGQLLGNSGAGGASTLTMQVSKNALTDTTSSGIKGIIRKFTDVYLSVFKIEKQYTKQDIIELYLNSEFLGNQSFGVEQASQVYFGKSASNLSLSEAALIAGLFQAPSAYDPYVYPEKAEARRNQVLNLMVRHGYINEEEASTAKAIPVKGMLTERKSNLNIYQGYIDTVIEEVMDKYDVNPYKVPIEIYTYFESDKQDVINSIYNGSAGYTFKDDAIQLAVAVVDNKNGALIAVGARRNDKGELGYNYATMINRHPGSTIKPILDYGPAIEYLNWSTYTPLFDEEVSYTKGGSIKNWNNKYQGLVTMKTALSKSMNTAALQAFQATSNEQKWNFATSLGITPGNAGGIIHESASIGAFEGVNPKKLAGAYSAFANGGYYTEAHSVKSIKFKETNETKEIKYTRERVMKETTAYMITDILFNVTTSSANIKGTQVASKTGTSSYDTEFLKKLGLSNNVIQDSWVATYNPDYTISFWYGYDELTKEMVEKKQYNLMSSATTNRNKIHGILAKGIFNTGSKFTVPKGISEVEVELETIPARLASAYTPTDLRGKFYFIAGTEPTETSTRFTELENPTNIKVLETGTSATVSWTSPSTPSAVSLDYLTNYFNNNFKNWAEKNFNLRLEYNNKNIGTYGFDIYLKSGANLTYVGRTDSNSYTINNTTGYDSVVVKSAYSIFKTNQSSGASAELTGSSTTFSIELKAISTRNGDFVHPTYSIGETIPEIGTSTIKFLINNLDVTKTIPSTDISYKIEDCTNACKKVDKIDSTKAGEYEITYTVNYLGSPHKEIRYIHIK